MNNVDEITLNFDDDSLLLLNFLLAFIMFGVALSLKSEDFKRVLKNPKASVIGLVSQWVLLPLITVLLIFIFEPQPSIALGMVLVSVCPGGNISNFISNLAGANTALSISLTALTTSAAIFMTPLSFAFWSYFIPASVNEDGDIAISVYDMFSTILMLIIAPVAAGMLFNKYLPKTTEKIKKPINIISLLIFASFVVIAFIKNADYFLEFINLIFIIVLLHNGLAFLGGYLLAKALGLEYDDSKSISIETGIQNSGLALVLIFNFFDGLGGMAIVAGWWGIWHIIAGLALAYFWSGKKMLAA